LKTKEKIHNDLEGRYLYMGQRRNLPVGEHAEWGREEMHPYEGMFPYEGRYGVDTISRPLKMIGGAEGMYVYVYRLGGSFLMYGAHSLVSG